MLRAAQWNTTSCPAITRSTVAGSHTVPWTNSNPVAGRFSRRPVNRSSSTVTRASSASRRLTSALPTNPAPPVTSTRFPLKPMLPSSSLRSALEPEAQHDQRPEDAPAVAQQVHLGRAPRMIAHRDRRLPHAIAAAHDLEQEVGLELVAVEP